ncbi:MAG: YggT family protein [Nocardioides sp.]
MTPASIPGQIIEGLLWFFLVFLWVRFVFDWVQVFARSWAPRGWVVILLEATYSITDPPIQFLRRFIKPLRFGTVALDLSFIAVLLLAYVLLVVNRRLLL